MSMVCTNSKHRFTVEILPQTTAIMDYSTHRFPKMLLANGEFFVGAEVAVCNRQIRFHQAFLS